MRGIFLQVHLEYAVATHKKLRASFTRKNVQIWFRRWKESIYDKKRAAANCVWSLVLIGII